MSINKSTLKSVKSKLSFDKETGIFIWRVSVGAVRAGDTAGYKRTDGYIRISVNGKRYHAHRLAWFYTYGYFPENNIDHINRNRSDNRIENLREASYQCNARNSKIYKTNKTGVPGISFCKKTKKWESCITLLKVSKHLGRYKHFQNAVCARLAAEQCLDWSGCDSSSPAFKYVQAMVGGLK